METDKSKYRWRPTATCQKKCEERNHYSEEQRMEVMMVLGEPKQWVLRVPCQKFRNNSQPVQVRGDCGQRYNRAFALVRADDAAEHPASEEMGDRTHTGSLTAGPLSVECQL